ncbi:hypothetical protein BHM03_00059193 [Ensete ventricosum]|nr:hypothetical protein BHM03_00059193 [Ensete ventricosum]
MSQEHSTPGNPGEDVPPAMQPTLGEALQPLLPLFEDRNLSSHTLRREFEANFLASTHLKPTATSLLGMSRALLGPTSQAPEEESGESLACRSPTPQHSAQLYPD